MKYKSDRKIDGYIYIYIDKLMDTLRGRQTDGL